MQPPEPSSPRPRWFYANSDNRPMGPLSEDDLKVLFGQGVIKPETLLISEEGGDWRSYRDVFSPAGALVPAPIASLNPVPVAPSTKQCPFCAEAVAIEAKKCKHCGETLDVALRAAEEAKRGQANAAPMVFMNAGGGAAAPEKRRFPHLLHFILTVLTMGGWLVIWILHYLFRNKSLYR